jgi:uncharacterized protein (DUF924 family)
MDRAHALLEFWFGMPGTPDSDRPRAVWFKKDAEFDAALRARFLEDQKQAAAGQYDTWMETPDGSLALVLLLDQLPRNLYRGTPAAFASDEKARAVARHALDQGYDQDVPGVRRSFFYLPFEHSENLADQETSVTLCRALPPAGHSTQTLDYAIRHRDIIRRFGRFPHRNRVLGRNSTREEEAFLQESGSSF